MHILRKQGPCRLRWRSLSRVHFISYISDSTKGLYKPVDNGATSLLYLFYFARELFLEHDVKLKTWRIE